MTIISSKPDQVAKAIDEQVGRGLTILDGRGYYSIAFLVFKPSITYSITFVPIYNEITVTKAICNGNTEQLSHCI
jgi:uncharacterized membrane-anchored protein YitT (DUF2179 family)